MIDYVVFGVAMVALGWILNDVYFDLIGPLFSAADMEIYEPDNSIGGIMSVNIDDEDWEETLNSHFERIKKDIAEQRKKQKKD